MNWSIDGLAGCEIVAAMHEQDLAIVKGLVVVAWADGRIADAESHEIDALLEAFNAQPSEAREIKLFARQPRSLDDVPLTELSFDDRRRLFDHAVLMTYVDGEQSKEEHRLLDELAVRLRLSKGEADSIAEAAGARARELAHLR